MNAPDYPNQLGFVHQAEADLRRVLSSIPEAYEKKRIVIFIDDLDRCSPEKVAGVIEALNLFLAGEYPGCVFVIGMDTEMVAAVLQAAHKDLIAYLPADTGIPVGWRFMDKFVQLPFFIPQFSDSEVNKYVASRETFSDTDKERVKDSAKRVNKPGDIEAEITREKRERGLSQEQAEAFRERLEAEVVRSAIQKNLKSFNEH